MGIANEAPIIPVAPVAAEDVAADSAKPATEATIDGKAEPPASAEEPGSSLEVPNRLTKDLATKTLESDQPKEPPKSSDESESSTKRGLSADVESQHDAALPDALATMELPEMGCLSRTICAIKNKIRWQTPAWKSTECNTIAAAVLSSARRNNISPSLLLAIMINESDLNEKAARVSLRNNKIYAMDSGLMAVRCVLDRRKRCLNGNVRGMAWADLMIPATNISVGARELAYWRDGGAVTRTVVKIRDAQGRVRPVWKTVPCRHRDHAYWAHYNHGPRYIASGYPRHYPHRVAVLDHALATVLNVDPPELHGTRITVRDAGKRERTADHPLETRYKKLCSQIQSVGACSAVAIN